MKNNRFLLHEKPSEFISALEYTAGKTSFKPELIEKDYFCTVILNHLYSLEECPLVFKGGTLLTKVHTGFYRLSEDLDFTIPISSDVKRKARSSAVKPMKAIINSIDTQLDNFKVDIPLTGSNESRQYNATLVYTSIINNQPNKILIEIGLREKQLTPATTGMANTILLNPFTASPYLPPINCQILSKHEAYAEKVRAALTRDRLAIRDYFDIYHAIKTKVLDTQDKHFIDLAQRKIADSPLIEFNSETLTYLDNKIQTELIPNLRVNEANDFDLSTTMKMLRAIVNK
jgi:predicted nucleotidyltransferase component of viral defense system